MSLFQSDLHNHSAQSRCSRPEMTVEAMVRRFDELGLRIAGISDHVYPDGKAIERYRQTKRELADLSCTARIWVGAEVDVLWPGRFDATMEEIGTFDYVLFACTHYQNRTVPAPIASSDEAIAQNAVDMMTYAASLPFADVIVHPFHITGMERYRDGFSAAAAIQLIPDESFTRIARDMAKNRIAIELNGVLEEADYAQAMIRFYRICKIEGVKFSLGSDAHWLAGMGSIMHHQAYVEALGVTETDIWVPEG